MNEKEKEKNKKPKGIIENIRQSKKESQRKADEKNEKELKKHEEQREEYAKELAEDKVDLLKVKQGMLNKEDIYESDDEQGKKYTVWQKFKNFIYHNKWWLSIASFLVLIAGFLIYDKLTTKKPDVNFMLLSYNTDLSYKTEDMERYFSEIIKDYNEDGTNYANVVYIPISDDEKINSAGMYESNLTRLGTQLNMGITMLVIADKNLETVISPDDILINLEDLYPDNKNIKKYAFYLKDTKFAEKIGYTGELPDDIYIGVRKITSTLSSKEETARNYDVAVETLDAIIKELSDNG